MRKLLYTISIAFLLLFTTQCGSKEKALHQKLEEMAANLNESAPVMLDQFTRFEGASVSSENIFRYNYTVLHASNPDSLVEAGLKMLRKNIEKEFASHPDLRIFKENEVVIEYIYKDEKGRTVSTLQIKPEDYHLK